MPFDREAYMRQYRVDNADKIREQKRQWCIDHPEEIREYNRQYSANHTEEKREYQRKYVQENSAQEAERKRRYAETHRDERREYMQRWHKDNPDKRRTYEHKRRATKLSSGGSWTDRDIKVIYAQQDGKCAYCGIELNGTYHIDHIHPLSRGGSNWPDNLACACARCNLSKSDKTIEEWLAQLGKTSTI